MRLQSAVKEATLFFEKHSRFVRTYNLTIKARHKLGAALPLFKQKKGLPSLHEALEKKIGEAEAEEKQSNGDVVSLVKVIAKGGALVLLFHRDRENAPDPTYRKIKGGKRILRDGTKDADEEQSHSAHLLILPDLVSRNQYLCALEEIPGLSMGTLWTIFRKILAAYPYDYTDKNGEIQETTASLKYEGIKSESFAEALKKGVLSIKLSRPVPADVIDGEGLVEPGRQTATLKIKAQLDTDTMLEKLSAWRDQAHKNGWTDFGVDLELDNKRQKTVKIDREAEAKEILFVRSEQIVFKTALRSCAPDIVPEFVIKSIELLRRR
jgi:hypothetical protein